MSTPPISTRSVHWHNVRSSRCLWSVFVKSGLIVIFWWNLFKNIVRGFWRLFSLCLHPIPNRSQQPFNDSLFYEAHELQWIYMPHQSSVIPCSSTHVKGGYEGDLEKSCPSGSMFTGSDSAAPTDGNPPPINERYKQSNITDNCDRKAKFQALSYKDIPNF